MTIELLEKLQLLEQRIEKLEFHKSLLQQLTRSYEENSLFDEIISHDLSRNQFQNLLDITKKYVHQLEIGQPVLHHEFLEEFKEALGHEVRVFSYDQFAKAWLKGIDGSFGMSKRLADHFNY
ncbi:DUF1878 family protein [Solibacillus sp. FSL H8-0538]|uniref:DUF1878 family protein n=1 Tax=Solibacillus sp. FSL H8-0538 TaxID=2921400 RepID=UPI0030F66CFE